MKHIHFVSTCVEGLSRVTDIAKKIKTDASLYEMNIKDVSKINLFQ